MTLAQRAAKLDPEKENRVPRGMVAPGSHGKNNLTPGRRKKAQDQYFEPGKVGRKTGLTLKDTGIRDEYGMEPMSGIFSSPAVSPQRSPQRNGDKTLTSSDMNVQDSSAPDVNETLRLRNTPKLPPPRAGTPKHTHIGSPKRMSAARPMSARVARVGEDESLELVDGSKTQPKPNRVLNFGGEIVHKTIEATSPFKPRNALRRSTGGARPDPFDLDRTPEGDSDQLSKELSGAIDEVVDGVIGQQDEEEDAPFVDDEPLQLDNYEDDDDEEDDVYQPLPEDDGPDLEEAKALQEMEDDTPLGRKRRQSRKSGGSVNSSLIQQTPTTAGPSNSKKRNRMSMENSQVEGDESVSQVQEDDTTMTHTNKRSRPSTDGNTLIIRDDDDHVETIDPSMIAYGDRYVDEMPASPEPQPKAKGRGRPKKTKSAPRERDPDRPTKAKGQSVELNDTRGSQSPTKRGGSRGGSMGPVSNVHLRATTPMEDCNGRTSRYGRSVIQPLKYWENESRVWNHGEIEGIIRADHVEKPKPAPRKKSKGKKRAQHVNTLDDIQEESDAESTAADEWEEEVGVIAGEVANWDVDTQAGNPEDPIREDLAFASSAIQTRDVASGDFKYAKIITMPFFGSGVVELPPGGFKKPKPSAKMQMIFFVHEGKVMVEVGPKGIQTNQFAITKGGVWVVPRGNFYSITNESSTKTARVFFAQGAEVLAGGS